MKKLLLLIAFVVFAGLNGEAQRVTTVAGTGGTSGFAPSSVSLSTALFYDPVGIMVDSYDRVWVTEGTQSSRVRVIDFPTDAVYHKTGNALDPANGQSFGYVNQSGNVAKYDDPQGLDIASDGKIYIADFNNHAIRSNTAVTTNVATTQVVATFVGEAPPQGFGDHVDATGTAARFNKPTDVVIDANGIMYVADNYNEVIRKVVLSSGVVTTIAGGVGLGGDADGTGSAARFNNVTSLAVLDANHIVICDSWNHKIKKLNTSTGAVTTIAGDGTKGHADGNAAAAQFRFPTGVAVDKFGAIYVSEGGDGQSNCIRKIANGSVTTIVGEYQTADTTNGIGTDARFFKPYHMDFSTDGSILYVADRGNHTIRAIDFNPEAAFSGSPTSTQVNVPVQITDESVAATNWSWTITPSTFTYVNGTNANSQNPQVEFTAAGSYTVTLEASNDFGTSTLTRNNYFNISDVNTTDPPVADFTASATTGNVGDVIKFTDQSTNTPSQWLWTVLPGTHQFVNSTTKNTQNPEIQFTGIDQYTIILKASNANGDDSELKSKYITIGPVGIEEHDLSEVVKVYPNPTQGSIFIEAVGNFVPTGMDVKLYDFSGRMVYQKDNVQLDNRMAIPSLSTGVYLLELNDGSSVVKKKIVVQ